ncbi:glycoside hydrolase family 18 protein [Pseudalkalibacillus sp. A8]|uniref:glycoside hydrolase family 18 protein n=1 Tax=Pseudalkalibacillus sp. A8 TaxID=3382641 RepID=UPI0038B5404A
MGRQARNYFNQKPFFISLLFLLLIGTFTYVGNSLPASSAAEESRPVEGLSDKQTSLAPKPIQYQKRTEVTENEYRRIGYYAGWSAYSGFDVADIDASKLTHINYAFANISKDGKIAVGDPWVDIENPYPGDTESQAIKGNFNQLNKLKKQHPHLKTLVSVGGWTWSENFSDVALTEQSRTIFAKSVLGFVQKYGFDGVDLDWEYPVNGGQPDNINRPEDKRHYTLLLKKIRETFNAQSKKDGEEYLLTIASGPSKHHAGNMELDKLHKYVDYIQLMTYDIHGEWDELTGFNAPLYQDPKSGFFKEWSVHDSVQTFIDQGVPADKLVLGLPFYGRMFKQANNANDGLYQPFAGGGKSVSYAALDKEYINKNGFTRYWDDDSHVPWLWNGDTVISYDDAESIGHKTDYIKSKGLGGAMIWELSQDPDEVLLTKVNEELK